jgi:selenocysteine-specific elongation factor
MRVIGTAGHVDHGKSTLVAALTGTHPDRLKEEQEREMTIDLGFAWMSLPGGETVGIVDVPGHRDFIENMLSGVGGIDAALFVVAADEGVMPQTREHLAILDLLQIQGGVIALTKTDLVPDAEWLEMVKEDVRLAVRGTVLGEAALVPVSARSGSGLAELVRTLETCLADRPPRPDLGRPRLPVDRVFTITGFGTVVTGTLLDGRLKLGDEVVLLPDGLRCRVRGLQSHKQKEQIAHPGSRTAVNLSGIDLQDVRRGMVLTQPEKYRPSHLMDVRFRMLSDSAGALRHSSEVKFFLGAAEELARVRLLGVEELRPGEEAWLQLELRNPVVAVRSDRFILRRPSPSETLGGGVIVDAHPSRRHRRFDPLVLARLETLQRGTPAELLGQAFQLLGPASIKDAVTRARLEAGQATEALIALVAGGELVLLEGGDVNPGADLLAAHVTTWNVLSEKLRRELDAFHAANPLRRGMAREELKSRLKQTTRLFNALTRRLSADGIILEAGPLIARADFRVRLTPLQQTSVDRLLARCAVQPFATPSVKEAQAEVGEDLYQVLIESGTIIQVSPEVLFRREDYDRMVNMVREHFEREPTLTVVQWRDQLNTSRKYVLAFLEHLDASGITLREGDFRRLRR